jgi:hypothetical protein
MWGMATAVTGYTCCGSRLSDSKTKVITTLWYRNPGVQLMPWAKARPAWWYYLRSQVIVWWILIIR